MANIQINENWQKMIITRFNQILFLFFFFSHFLLSLSLSYLSPPHFIFSLFSAPPSSLSLFSHCLLSAAPSLYFFPLPSLCFSLSSSLYFLTLFSLLPLYPSSYFFTLFFLLPLCYLFLFSHSPLSPTIFYSKKMFKHIYNPLPFKYKLTLALVFFQKLKKYFSPFNLESDAEIRQWFFTVCIFLFF